MRWAILVLAVSLMVGWTSAAAAECAWMLWGQMYKESPYDLDQVWTFYAGFESQSQCLDQRMQARQKVIKSVTRELKKFAKVWVVETDDFPITFFVENRGGGGYTLHVQLACLPDTIDPREKK